MQIRHSYSIGSIVPFSSSTTFTTTGKTKTAANARISYRPGLHFLTLRVQFSESHWNVEIFSIRGFLTNIWSCAHSVWTAAHCAHGVPPSTPAERSSFSLHILQRQKPQQLDSDSFTNIKYTVKIQPLACSWALREWTVAVFLGDFQGTDIFCFVVRNVAGARPPVSSS